MKNIDLCLALAGLLNLVCSATSPGLFLSGAHFGVGVLMLIFSFKKD